MSKNIEFKAYYSDLERARSICSRLGAEAKRGHWQRDTYFAVQKHRLKLRESDTVGACLIYYRRIDDPSVRESSYVKIDLPESPADLRELFSSELGVRIVVEKHRETFFLNSSLINLDKVPGVGSFLEVEVDTQKCGELEALQHARDLMEIFGVREIDIVPWSYSELVASYRKASHWRAETDSIARIGHLFLIDGPSGSGKSTLASRVRKTFDSSLRFARRHCTRKRRADEEDEYIFISNEEFNAMSRTGEFLEHRNFEFGMSYGLAWTEAMPTIIQGGNVLAIMNWGNASHVRRIFPSAKIILAKASQETLRRRINSRGIHNADQLQERLANALRFSGYDELYDLVVSNEDGELESAIESIGDYISNCVNHVTQNA
jgi:adenylate cyclase, class 2